ncbi:hypothetical protein B0H15DRAFT_988432 [Mycena belliarum]|uniref:Uncharacterized protein n=1 Tax=Mycena belliarum TaxID=1033014 RepID=A0AAD6U023_9AGAR|nr:hypothetical protein B0H15DRAFT_988432 [Mycena belliae]
MSAAALSNAGGATLAQKALHNEHELSPVGHSTPLAPESMRAHPPSLPAALAAAHAQSPANSRPDVRAGLGPPTANATSPLSGDLRRAACVAGTDSSPAVRRCARLWHRPAYASLAAVHIPAASFARSLCPAPPPMRTFKRADHHLRHLGLEQRGESERDSAGVPEAVKRWTAHKGFGLQPGGERSSRPVGGRWRTPRTHDVPRIRGRLCRAAERRGSGIEREYLPFVLPSPPTTRLYAAASDFAPQRRGGSADVPNATAHAGFGVQGAARDSALKAAHAHDVPRIRGWLCALGSAGLCDGVAEGLWRLWREMRAQRQRQLVARTPRVKGGNDAEALKEDPFLQVHADWEGDNTLLAGTSRNEESVTSVLTPATSAHVLDEERGAFELDVGISGDDEFGEWAGWGGENARAVEEAETCDNISVVGLLDKE